MSKIADEVTTVIGLRMGYVEANTNINVGLGMSILVLLILFINRYGGEARELCFHIMSIPMWAAPLNNILVIAGLTDGLPLIPLIAVSMVAVIIAYGFIKGFIILDTHMNP
jgi:hypothetical protein